MSPRRYSSADMEQEGMGVAGSAREKGCSGEVSSSVLKPVSVDRAGGRVCCWHELRSSIPLVLGLLLLLSPYLRLPVSAIAFGDDAYYYLLPAVKFWELGHYSFDGLTTTNGFHPLWVWMLTACTFVLHGVDGIEALPRVALWLIVLLALWGSVLWFGVLRRSGVSPWSAQLVVVVTVVAMTGLFVLGLETVLVYWSLALLARYLVGRIGEAKGISPWWLGFYASLVVFSRLDGVLFLLGLYGVLFFTVGARRVLCAGGVLCVLVAPYLGMNYVNHGGVVPISGQVKEHWGDRYALETSGQVFGPGLEQVRVGPGKTRLRHVVQRYVPRDLGRALNALSFNRIADSLLSGAVALAVLFGALIAGVLRWRRSVRQGITPAGQFLMCFVGCMALAYLLGTVYYALSYDQVWAWYGAVGVMVMAGGLAFLVGGLLRSVGGKALPAVVALLLVVFWTVSVDARLGAREKNFDQSLRSVYLKLADWLSRTEEDAVAAGWAVGEIGWNAHRPVINLEGLAANQRVLDANRATDLLPILVTYKVSYIVNFWRPDYAPLPEAVLAPTESDGRWKDGRVRYFWTLRLRPMMDCPEAFSIRYRYELGDHRGTSGYVLGVDQEVVSDYLVKRAGWRSALARYGTVIPAEDFTALRSGQVEANLRRTEGYFVRGTGLVYSLDEVAPGQNTVYGRVCNLSGDTGRILVKSLTDTFDVEIAPVPHWEHVRLGTVQVEREELLPIVSMSNKVYLDQLYFVVPDKAVAFESIAADWWRGSADE